MQNIKSKLNQAKLGVISSLSFDLSLTPQTCADGFSIHKTTNPDISAIA